MKTIMDFWMSTYFKRLIKRADELDEAGLYLDSLEQYKKALVLRPKACEIFLRICNTCFKLDWQDEASYYLKMARHFAISKHHRYSVCQMELQLICAAFQNEPKESLIRKGLEILDQASKERKHSVLVAGRKSLLCLEAVDKLDSLSIEKANLYLLKAERYFSDCIVNAGKYKGNSRKYLHRILSEMADYHDLMIGFSWIELLRKGKDILVGKRYYPPSIVFGKFLPLWRNWDTTWKFLFFLLGIIITIDNCDL